MSIEYVLTGVLVIVVGVFVRFIRAGMKIEGQNHTDMARIHDLLAQQIESRPDPEDTPDDLKKLVYALRQDHDDLALRFEGLKDQCLTFLRRGTGALARANQLRDGDSEEDDEELSEEAARRMLDEAGEQPHGSSERPLTLEEIERLGGYRSS